MSEIVWWVGAVCIGLVSVLRVLLALRLVVWVVFGISMAAKCPPEMKPYSWWHPLKAPMTERTKL